MATVGYAAMASFIVLDLNSKHVGHGATAFAAFAFTVVITRRSAATCRIASARFAVPRPPPRSPPWGSR